MFVIIHADGEGSRLRPHTEHIPKAMIPINGKPFLEHQITNFRDNWGARDFIITQGRKAEVIQEHFGDGDHLGVTIRHQVRDYPATGTSLPMKRALASVPASETYVVHSVGDIYTNLDPRKFIKAHSEGGAPITMHCAQVEFPFGIPKNPDANGVFTELEEKPIFNVNTSLAIVNRDIHPLLPETGYFFTTGLQAVGGAKMYVDPQAEWLHINDESDWRYVDEVFRRRQEREARIATEGYQLPGWRV